MKQFINSYIIIISSSIFLYACSNKKQVKEEIIRPVKYAKVVFQDGAKIRVFSGTAENDKIRSLSFRTGGLITKFNIRLGMKVKKGQELARLDNVASRLSYDQAINQLRSSESQKNTAKLSLDRIRDLYEKGSSSLSEFESAKDSYKSAIENYESAKRGAEIQKEQIQYGYIYAPSDGVIAAINAEIDENVTSGQVVATLNSGENMEVVIGIPENTINNISENLKVEVSFSSLNKVFKGTVTEVSPAVDSNTATYPVRITISDNTNQIKSGMSANVTFDFSNKKSSNTKTLYAPASAVGEDSNGRFVFLIIKNDSTTVVKKHPIKVGNLSSNGFEVLSGLSSGQIIATAGLQILLDGQQVKLN